MDLVEFLTARLDETQAALLARRDGHLGPCLNFEGQRTEDYDEHDSCFLHIRLAESTPYHHTAFGLAEVDAKRRIVTLYAEAVLVREEATKWAMSPSTVITNPGAEAFERWNRARDAALFLEPAVCLLALPYASHPDYNEAWRP